MLPRMPKFRHLCAPCNTCESAGVVHSEACQEADEGYICTCPACETCEGASTPCDCEGRYEDEGDRRYHAWAEGG